MFVRLGSGAHYILLTKSRGYFGKEANTKIKNNSWVRYSFCILTEKYLSDNIQEKHNQSSQAMWPIKTKRTIKRQCGKEFNFGSVKRNLCSLSSVDNHIARNIPKNKLYSIF